MNDLVRPSSLLSAGVPPSAATGVAGTVAHPPPEAARLPAGTILRGVVVGADPQGYLVVRTKLGDLSVATKAQLAPASDVTLQVRSTGAQLHVLLMQGRAPPAVPAADLGHAAARPGLAAEGRPQGPTPPPVGPAAPVDHLTLGQTVRAVLRAPLPLAPEAAASAGVDPAVLRSLSRLSPGSALTLRLLAASAPAPAQPAQVSGTGSATLTAGNSPTGSHTAIPSPTSAAGGIALSGAAASAGLPAGARPAAGVPPAGAAQVAPPATPATLTSPTSPASNLTQPGQAPSGPVGQAIAPPATTPRPATAVPGVAGADAAPPPAQTVRTDTAQQAGQRAASAPAGQAAPQAPPGSAPAPRTPIAPTAPPPATATTSISSGPAAMPASPSAMSSFLAGADGGVRFGAVVTQVTPAGNPVLASPLGTLVLETPITLPRGGTLTVEVPRGGASAPGPLPPASGMLTHAWPALTEAIAIFREVAAPGVPPVPDTMPQPGARLASGILFVLAALTGGHIDRWLGPQPLKALKAAGKDALAAQLGRDFAQMSRLGDAAAGEWRLLPIPLWDGQAVQPLRLFLRQRGDGDAGPSGGEADDATRFILEIEMSRLGDLQLDGLVRDKRFDLMFRSRSALPEPMREGIRRVFQEANDAAGYTGQIAFQASRGWQPMPLPDTTATSTSPLVV